MASALAKKIETNYVVAYHMPPHPPYKEDMQCYYKANLAEQLV